MSFVNRYTKPDVKLLKAAEFFEGNDSFVYAVGYSGKDPVVMKSKPTGEIVWTRSLLGKADEMRFYDIIQLKSLGKPSYVISVYNNKRFFLFSIKSDSGLNWIREVDTKDEDIHAHIVANNKQSGFYFALSDKNDVDTHLSPKVLHLDTKGNVVRQTELVISGTKHEGFIVNAIDSHKDGLVVAGRLIGKGSAGITVDLDHNLRGNAARIYSKMTIQDILAQGKESYVVSAYSSADKGIAVFQVKPLAALPYRVLSQTPNMHSVLSEGPKGFFLSTHHLEKGYLHRFKGSFDLLWSKSIKLGDESLGLRSIAYQTAGSSLTFSTLDLSLLGRSNADFDACIAVDRKAFKTTKKNLLTRILKVVPGISKVKLAKTTGKIIRFNTNAEDVCKTDPDDLGGTLVIREPGQIQSPHFYLQAAGSTGEDSTAGIHLRWLLKGALSEHLPKADYAVPNVNFNKEDDYVRIYRAPYATHRFALNFDLGPTLTRDYEWLYRSGDDAFYLNFLDQERYDDVRRNILPSQDPAGFLTAYGSAPLELESRTRLSFAITLEFSAVNPQSRVDIELTSVEENRIDAPRAVTFRKRGNAPVFHNQQLFSENIRSIRFRMAGTGLRSVFFEFYDQFIAAVKSKDDWHYLGRHALTKETPIALNRLEPVPNSVHGKWLRFNDEAFVNIENYKKRWNSPDLPRENRIVEAVDTYIRLSNDPDNPRAIEQVHFNDPNAAPNANAEEGFDPSDNQFDLSNLFVLQLASLDYHTARMLGLGLLDLDQVNQAGKFVYLAEYITKADLGDGNGRRDFQHLYMSLPTGRTDDRLPLPIDLKEPVPGLIHDATGENPIELTDEDGYSHDGRTRFLSLFPEELPEEALDAPFFSSDRLFISAQHTSPVYGGIEYKRTGNADWQKPELPHSETWFNIDATTAAGKRNETRPIVLPEPPFPLFVHRERHSGSRDFSSYGINWFSRATASDVVHTVVTTIKATNRLRPPNNVNALLIQAEEPLLLTSRSEQEELSNLNGDDKTFVRLSFEYNHGQELVNYHKETDGELVRDYAELPDAEELFAEKIEVFFRNELPATVSGKVVRVDPHPNGRLAVVTTGEFVLESQGEDPETNAPNDVLVPDFPDGREANFVGGALAIEGVNYVIQDVDNDGQHPVFTVFKSDFDGNSLDASSNVPEEELLSPPVDKLFAAVENMSKPESWGGDPLDFRINIDHREVNREEVVITQPDGTQETHVQKFRGILKNALVEEVLEDDDGDEDPELGFQPGDTPRVHRGLYKLTFNGFSLPQHSQSNGPGHRAEFHKGVVRMHTAGLPNGPRKSMPVIRAEHIGSGEDLVLFIADLSFDPADPNYDAIPTGVHSVNYYPDYKCYFFRDNAEGLNAANILPQGSETLKNTLFGLRSHDTDENFNSPVSTPAPMFAQVIPEPQQPRLPLGGTYATRPDFHGKSTYTFTTEYLHEPHAAQFLRGSDIQILSALYTNDSGGDSSVFTVQRIKEEIFKHGEDEWYNDRWSNLIGFDYNYPNDPGNNGRFEKLPAGPEGIALPLPNNPRFIAAINAFIRGHNEFFNVDEDLIDEIDSLHQVIIPAGPRNAALQVLDFMREAVYNCFVPLTEIPVIFEHIKGGDYEPIPKKQVVRNRNGELLRPDHPDFDMAPMAKRIRQNPPETQFTDFNIDGASNAKYFYAVREFNLRMKPGRQSPILGPISLVNTAAPRSPEPVKVTPVFENRIANIRPAIEVTVNSYAANQHIRKVNLYRATNPLDAQSIRSMTLAAVLEIDPTDDALTWTVRDEFADLDFTPYGDPLFYVATVSREVQYNDREGNPVVEYAPSEPSRRLLTNIVENTHPEAPRLAYFSTPPNAGNALEDVALVWEKTVHNGKYHLQQRNSEGNWIDIAVVKSNDPRVVVPLARTAVGSGTLPLENAGGKTIYHHFKVVAVNFAGMSSQTDDILTIHHLELWQDIAEFEG